MSLIKKLLNLNMVYIVAAVIAIGALVIPRAIDIINLRTQGISYFTNHTENYHNNAHSIEGEYTIGIDLNNLENNEGKKLFDDGENQISLLKVIAHNSKEYELLFRSRGSYNSGGATLVSGLEYKHNNDGFISNFQAEAEATYRSDTYKLRPSESIGLKYRDGDEFSFYFELPDGLVSDFEEEKIDVTVTNLALNLWAEKSF